MTFRADAARRYLSAVALKLSASSHDRFAAGAFIIVPFFSNSTHVAYSTPDTLNQCTEVVSRRACQGVQVNKCLKAEKEKGTNVLEPRPWLAASDAYNKIVDDRIGFLVMAGASHGCLRV